MNRSKTYIFPFITKNLENYDLIKDCLQNTFLFDDNNTHNNSIYCLFKFQNTIQLELFDKLNISNNNLIDVWDININECIYIFNIPNKYINDYNLILNSKYSEISIDAKKIILNFWSKIYGNNGVNAVRQVLYKDPLLKQELEKKLNVKIHEDSELGQYFDLEKEIINIEINLNSKRELLENINGKNN